jgi:hypothetical protein
MLAALAGGLASDTTDSRTRRSELQSALRFAVLAEEPQVGARVVVGRVFAAAVEIHDARTALLASDSSLSRAERSLRRVATHARAALLKTTVLPPPTA